MGAINSFVLNIDMLVYMLISYTRNELASLAHSFYTCLKPPLSSDNCTLQVCIPWVHILLYGNLFFAKVYTVEKFTISHVAAQRDRLK